jgi:hypothetical protein
LYEGKSSGLDNKMYGIIFYFYVLFLREHYLLNLIQSYLFVLTNTLDLLGVDWQKQGKS